MPLSTRELKNFIKSNNLGNIFIAKCCTLKIFLDKLVPLISKTEPIKVAIVGGDSNELELNFLPTDCKVTIFGIDLADVWLDLNYIPKVKHSFDFVICNQVLEHVWDHENAFINLSNITKKSGLLWITLPCSNFAHGSPFYFCAGFNNLYVDQQAIKHNFTRIDSSSFGSLRLYRFQHLINIWPPANEYFKPVVWFFFNRLNWLKANIFCRLILSTSSSKIEECSLTNTETWGIYRMN